MSIIPATLLSLAAATSAVQHLGKNATPAAIVEAAPLRGLLGQLAVRAEAPFLRKFAVAAGYEQFSTGSERANFHDTHAAESAELLFYPLGFADYPVFFAAGVRHERVVTGRQRLRDSNSWIRTNADELYDAWTNIDTYLSSTQAVGYRLLRLNAVTASFRLQRDELMSTSSSVKRDDVKSFDPDLTGSRRKQVATALVLHAGVYLP